MPTSEKGAPEVELDLGRYELRRLGRRVKLEKKPMDLLIFLLSHRDQLVSRDEIVRKLWRSDLFIDTEKNLNNIVRKLRTALGDNPDKPRFLETVVGKGYRFVGPVRVIKPKFRAADSERGPQADSRKDSERTSIAVLPLVLLGKADADQGLCLGFAAAVVTLLGNLPDLDVLPTSAIVNLPAEAGPAEIAARLGVRFVVHGAVQLSKGQWRLSLRLVDTYLDRSSFTKKCDLDLNRLPLIEAEIAKGIAAALNRPLVPYLTGQPRRFSRDPVAYAEFMRGYRITASGNAALMDQASHHLATAVTRDPGFALAHATLSFACATRHFEFDPASALLEKAEFHCRRALELAPDLPEGHLAHAFLLWGPSKNFQHLEAIDGLKRAIRLQANLPHAYNRLGTILAHIGLLDRSREMFERGRPFQPKKAISPSIVQVYVWGQHYDQARYQIQLWRAENPTNKYAMAFAPHPALMTGDWKEAARLIDEALRVMPNEPLYISLQAQLHAMMGNAQAAIECVTRACSSPKSFGHAHHTYYQIACTLALTGRRETAFEWLERTV
ncbi:MAG TPA: winged helix-turn-helix domain-containing protein, partial [Terriglobales bacterium]|nr:winged helix-turn-helix domain-containing protein [Terriglobales bacterium]